MPALSAQRVTDQPLSEDERILLDKALRGVRSELRAFLGAMPVKAQHASGLSRALDIERTTCQRVVSAVTTPYPGPVMVESLPGPAGLTILADAATPEYIDADQHVALIGAITTYDEAIRRLGRSVSSVIRRLKLDASETAANQQGDGSASTGPLSSEANDEQRRLLFDASAAITGRSSDLWLATHVFAPDAANPNAVYEVRCHGLVGHWANEDAVPLTIHVFGDDPQRTQPREEIGSFSPLLEAGASASDALLADFSTTPAPLVRSRTPGESVVQTIDGTRSTDAPIDLMFALAGRITHPRKRDDLLQEVWALINFPVRRMLFNVFLHRDIARGCLPSLDNHLWRPDFGQNSGERWQTRFSSPPPLTVLGAGPDRWATDAYARFDELNSRVFEAAGLDPNEFVGYRCDFAFPVWRTGYCISFDFSQ